MGDMFTTLIAEIMLVLLPMVQIDINQFERAVDSPLPLIYCHSYQKNSSDRNIVPSAAPLSQDPKPPVFW